jgi:hypothetical protein
MITIGRMAEKFHMLPHVIEQNATTYDFMIVDVLAAYDRFQASKAKNKIPSADAYNLSQDQLQKIIGKNKK